MKTVIHASLAAALCSTLSGCPAPTEHPDAAVMPDGARGSGIAAVIGQKGGSLSDPRLGGATLTVPAGALASDTMITVSMGESLAQAGQTTVGPSVHFEPAGLSFATPVAITLPFSIGTLPANSEVTIITTAPGQPTALAGGLLNIDSQASTISVNVSQLGDFQAVYTGNNLPALNKDVDILFMIDNSPSMSPKQTALVQNIPKFIQAIEALGVNYHVGITTSDVGSWAVPGSGWNNLGSCDTFAGDDGTLQAVPCTKRTFTDANAPGECATLCPDPSYLPADGTSFISKIDGVNNVKPGDPLAAQKAFQCMALVGDQGCGIEGQLEGAKRALDNHNPVNAGFLRDNSLLTVVFITDEDDCSVSPSGRPENDPSTMDCETPDQNAPFACYNPDYRCLAMDVQCDQPMNQPGLHTGCTERPSSYLGPVAEYVNFFASLRPTNRLYVSGIWTTPALDRGDTLNVVKQNGGTTSDTLNRDIGANAGCVNAADSTVYGRPQLRLSRLARNFNGSMEVSICDTANYATVLNNLAAAIARKMGM